MNFRSSGRSRRVETTLELTPLIDVVFLLLIFFLITTTFAEASEAEIPINLPTAVTGEAGVEGERMVLMVNADGAVIMEDDEGEWEGDDLRDRLVRLHEANPETSILLKGDVAASHGKVVELLDLVKQVGFKRVNLVISKPK